LVDIACLRACYFLEYKQWNSADPSRRRRTHYSAKSCKILISGDEIGWRVISHVVRDLGNFTNFTFDFPSKKTIFRQELFAVSYRM
jgi:hypothetical protein